VPQQPHVARDSRPNLLGPIAQSTPFENRKNLPGGSLFFIFSVFPSRPRRKKFNDYTLIFIKTERTLSFVVFFDIAVT
jgi:hypothetical protein